MRACVRTYVRACVCVNAHAFVVHVRCSPLLYFSMENNAYATVIGNLSMVTVVHCSCGVCIRIRMTI